MNLKIIYEPKGEAAEYADLALNYYKGCTFKCKYCYNNIQPWYQNEKYFSGPMPKENVIDRLWYDCQKLKNTECPPIFISFMGDPYCYENEKLRLTTVVLNMLIKHNLPFTILSKGGMLAAADLNLLENYEKCSFGQSISFMNESTKLLYEPASPSIHSRLGVLTAAAERGIKTWISLEPIIEPEEALDVIKIMHPIVDHFKIGKINHFPQYDKNVLWRSWRDVKLLPLLKELKVDYYLKKSLKEL